MRLDSIALSSVTSEIKNKLLPGKIFAIYQLSKYELLLVIKTDNFSEKLLISIRPDRMAFFLSQSPLPSDNFSTLFYNQLKNWIQGGTLLDIIHERFDRIIKLVIRPYMKFNIPKEYQLIIEFMGKHSNVVLIDEKNIIKSTLKQVGSDVNRYREIKAGINYIDPPRQNKQNPLLVSEQVFLNMLETDKDINDYEFLWKFFQNHFNGLGSKGAKELLAAMGFPMNQKIDEISKQEFPDLWRKFSKVQQKIKDNDFSPAVFINQNNNKVIDYSLFPLPKQQDGILKIPFDETSKCLEFIFNRLSREDKRHELYNSINKVLKKNIKKLEEKKRIFQDKKKEAENSEEYKKKGELIKANLYHIKPGTHEITVLDYYDTEQPKLVISLNPNLSPVQNAENYFKKYKKLQQNQGNIERYSEENMKSLRQLKEIRKKLEENKDSLEELSSIYEKLGKIGYIKKDKANSDRRKREQKPAISRFLSPDGWTILLGKNSKQNEYILRHLTSGNDFWLHNLSRPGGHVIIKNHKNLDSPPHLTLLFAARLAGYFSKTKDGETAFIILTMRKYVRKPKNAKLGKVIYSNEKTIPVEINHDRIKKEIYNMMLS